MGRRKSGHEKGEKGAIPEWHLIIWAEWRVIKIKGRVGRWRGRLGGAKRLPTLSVAGASRAPPYPVSTSPSSNRACGFAAPGSPTGFVGRHTGKPVGLSFTDPL